MKQMIYSAVRTQPEQTSSRKRDLIPTLRSGFII